MNDAAHEIDINAIAPGTVADEDITGTDGSVLLVAGTAITAAMLEEIRRHGITRLRVVGNCVAGMPRGDARLRYLFRGTAGNAPAEELQRFIAAYRQGEQQ